MKTKMAIVSGVLLMAVLGHQYMFSEIPVWKIPKLMSSMRAKEFCTCRFMLLYPTDFCLERVKKGYPLFSYEVDEKNKEVLFSNYFASARAKAHEDARYGCSLK